MRGQAQAGKFTWVPTQKVEEEIGSVSTNGTAISSDSAPARLWTSAVPSQERQWTGICT